MRPVTIVKGCETIMIGYENGEVHQDSDRRKVSDILKDSYDWEKFNVFELADCSGGKPLQTLVEYVLTEQGLIDGMQIDRARLASFLEELENAYESKNPYHTGIHAADVVQSVAIMIRIDSWSKGLKDWELLSMIIAAAGHDVGHQGVTNEYHDRVQTEWLRMYGKFGRSVNEYAHADITVSLLLEERNDFLHGIDPDTRTNIIKYVKETILHTDIMWHRDVCRNFEDACRRGKADLSTWSTQDRVQVLAGLLHFADISNPGRPWTLCEKWGYRVHDELVLQGDEEEKLGFERSEYCATGREKLGENQAAFIKKVMKPFCEQVSLIAPNFTTMLMPHIEISLKRWTEFHKHKN